MNSRNQANSSSSAVVPETLARLEEALIERLHSCPRTGRGVHRWLFGTACKLHAAHCDVEAMKAILRHATAGCGRDVSDREIEDAVRNSRPDVLGKMASTERPWPVADDEMIRKIAQSGPKLSELRHLSPVTLSEGQIHAERVIDAHFPGDPLLCVGRSQSRFETRSRSRWRNELAKCQFIVPSPMAKAWGMTKEGKRSMHCLDNTGPRHYLVTEFDPPRWQHLTHSELRHYGTEDSYYAAQRDVQAAVLAHLAQLAPLSLVVYSGGKSLQGWWPCREVEEDHLRKFMALAVKLGADPATWTRSQFVRLPDGRRDNGRRQSVLFFNPKVLEAR